MTNIIFVLIDTLRSDRLGCYGSRLKVSPNIDRLASKSVLFENAYTCITKTDPAMATIFSGLYPLSHGLVNHGHRVTPGEIKSLSNVKLLPEILSEFGYKTLAVDWLARFHRRGYDYYSGPLGLADKKFFNTKIPYFLRLADFLGTRYLKKDFFNRFYYLFAPRQNLPYDSAELVTQEAIKLVKMVKGFDALPFFLFVHYWDPHDPYVHPRSLSSALFDSIEARYSAEVGWVDHHLGKLVKSLEKSSLFDDSLIVLTGDHGESLGEHQIYKAHRSLYEPVVKVPLMFKLPSCRSKRIKALVQHVDILPTVLALAGRKVEKKNFDGQNLRPLIKNSKAKKGRSLAFFADNSPEELVVKKATYATGIRKGKYKFLKIEQNKKTDRELYDLKKDPEELENLFSQKIKIAKRLEKEMNDFINTLNRTRKKSPTKLEDKVKKSQAIIEKSFKKFGRQKLAIALTGGKDSVVMAHLVKTIYGEIPFKAFFGDTGQHFPEVYQFVDQLTKAWKVNLVVGKPKVSYERFKGDRLRCCHALKTLPQKEAIKKYGWQAIMAGIRWDEQKARSEEKYFSPRKNPAHIRVHPLLHWTEKDIWDYIESFNLPANPLYKKGYRSIGCLPCTQKAGGALGDGDERGGRSQDKEKIMRRLRQLGYW